jgi:hypothetical protein
VRVITRKSVTGGKLDWFRRKNSRTWRLIRLRTTELPTLPLTVMPKRLRGPSQLSLITTKFGAWNRLPVRDKFKNCGRLRRRADFGNRSLPGSDIGRDYERARFGGAVTVSFFRPLARRRRITFLPAGVAMRARNPWVRFLRILLG